MDLAERLDRSVAEQNKYQSLRRERLEPQHNRKSEQLSKEPLALLAAAWKARGTQDEPAAGADDDDLDGNGAAGAAPKQTPSQKRGGRQPLARHLKRERIVHDLAEAEKHCTGCGKDLRLIATKPPQPIEKSTAGASLWAQVIVAKWADPQPLHRQKDVRAGWH